MEWPWRHRFTYNYLHRWTWNNRFIWKWICNIFRSMLYVTHQLTWDLLVSCKLHDWTTAQLRDNTITPSHTFWGSHGMFPMEARPLIHRLSIRQGMYRGNECVCFHTRPSEWCPESMSNSGSLRCDGWQLKVWEEMHLSSVSYHAVQGGEDGWSGTEWQQNAYSFRKMWTMLSESESWREVTGEQLLCSWNIFKCCNVTNMLLSISQSKHVFPNSYCTEDSVFSKFSLM